MVLHMPEKFRHSKLACKCKMGTPVPAVLLNLHQSHLMPSLHLALFVTAVRHLQTITCAQSADCAVSTSLTSSCIHVCRSCKPSWPTATLQHDISSGAWQSGVRKYAACLIFPGHLVQCFFELCDNV